MTTTIIPETTDVTTANALWIIIKSQTEAVQNLIAERFIAQNTHLDILLRFLL